MTDVKFPDDEALTTDDWFVGDRLVIRQPRRGYRAGIDAVLLAAAVRPNGPVTILDVGAGVGVVGLCIAARLPVAQLTLFEQQPELVALASHNIKANGFEGRCRVEIGNLTSYSSPDSGAEQGLGDERFDIVVANPPFHDARAGTLSGHHLKAVSHALHGSTLDDWVRFMARMVRPGGIAFMIHRADALTGVLAAFGRRFGQLSVTPIYPRKAAPATRILISGIKGSRAPMQIGAGLVLHGDDGQFLPAIARVLRAGEALSLAYQC